MSDDGPVLVAEQAGWVEITLNRPAVLNALNQATLLALMEAVREASARPACRALILTGAGDRAFTAGADVAEMSGLEVDEVGRFLALGQEAAFVLEGCPQPVIAAVNGYALGGGCELALACDLVFAAESAQLGLPEVHLGIIPGWGGTQRLPRRIGLARARELTYTGRRVPAAEALRLGLVDRVVPAAHLMEEARAFAAELAGKSGPALAAAKAATRTSLDLNLTDGAAREAELFTAAFDTGERRAAMARFLKRDA
jgi:enoyl-CoA hydratase